MLNFAAESHVDRSIDGPRDFVETNMVGTFELLEASRHHWPSFPRGSGIASASSTSPPTRSTALSGPTGYFTETTPYAPNSPYSASKAGADHLVRAYHRTYDLPTLTTNCSNNYGPYQFPEKLIPLMILNAIEAKPLPIYGDGGNVRDWLYVEDHCEGILTALDRGRPGEQYTFGGERRAHQPGDRRRSSARFSTSCFPPPRIRPCARGASITTPTSRASWRTGPGTTAATPSTPSKVRSELGWRPRHDFDDGLRRTVRWYLEHREWCEAVQRDRYGRERLGLAGKKP